jgi:hypothetical protein
VPLPSWDQRITKGELNSRTTRNLDFNRGLDYPGWAPVHLIGVRLQTFMPRHNRTDGLLERNHFTLPRGRQGSRMWFSPCFLKPIDEPRPPLAYDSSKLTGRKGKCTVRFARTSRHSPCVNTDRMGSESVLKGCINCVPYSLFLTFLTNRLHKNQEQLLSY